MVRFKKTLCILISGDAGIGKTSLADKFLEVVSERGYKITKKPFAGTLKKIAAVFFMWDGLKDGRGRKLLQDIGSVGRAYDENIWVDYLLNDVEDDDNYPFDVLVVDDWRFPNEVERVKNNPLYNVIKIRVVGDSFLPLSDDLKVDVSETSLPRCEKLPDEAVLADVRDSQEYYDFIVNNKGGYDNLKLSATQIINTIIGEM